jgi:hypothetical protein
MVFAAMEQIGQLVAHVATTMKTHLSLSDREMTVVFSLRAIVALDAR